MTLDSYHKIKTSYYEATVEEFTLLNYQRVQIEEYLRHFFFQNGLILQKVLFQVSSKSLNLVLYYYLLDNISWSLRKHLSKKDYRLKKVFFRQRLFKNYRQKKDDLTLSMFLKCYNIEGCDAFVSRFYDPLIVRLYKKSMNKIKYKTISHFKKYFFHEYLLETISDYTKKKFNVSLVFKNVNRGINLTFSGKEQVLLKEQALLLKSYSKHNYFKDSLNLFVIAAKMKGSSTLFSKFLAEQLRYLKYHKPFLAFISRLLKILIYSDKFSIKGIKLLISGRLNNKSRSKHFVLVLGHIPIVTRSAEILDYSENTSYTKNGTLGVKVWCNHLVS
jgi:Ribosomal protein S3, C-terminal domain